MKGHGLARNAKNSYGVDMSPDYADAYIRKYFRLYRGVKRYQTRLIRDARKTGYVYVNWLGKPFRVRPVFDIMSPDKRKRGGAERIVLNTPIQGGAMEYTFKLLILMYRAMISGELPHVRRIVGTVHDSVWFTIDKRYPEEAFNSVGALAISLPTIRDVPLEIEGKCGKSLGDMKEVGVISGLKAA